MTDLSGLAQSWGARQGHHTVPVHGDQKYIMKEKQWYLDYLEEIRKGKIKHIRPKFDPKGNI